jgi:hypothetical protein
VLVAVLTIGSLLQPASASALAGFDEAKLTASDAAAGDRFGWSVAVSDDTAVAGAYEDDDHGSSYVFRYDGSDWVEEGKLRASDGAADDSFGRSVAVSGDTALVGANGDDDNGSRSGSAYVFRYDGIDWVEEAKLTASDGAADDSFGRSVAVSGDTALVGANGDDDNGSRSGSAYVFRYDGIDWVEEAKLTASDAAASDYFGLSVAVSGDTAVVGAFNDDDDGASSGSAHVFRYDGVDWAQEAKLTASDAAANDRFGFSVAVSGDTAVVGAYGDDDNGAASGSAYVFHYDGIDWVEEAKLTASDGAGDDYFGLSVAVSGETAVVGANGDDDNGSRSGSAHVFRYDGSDWVNKAKLTASDAAADDRFGYAVAVSGDMAVLGAYGDNDDGSYSGSATVFLIPPACGDGIDNDGDGLIDFPDDLGCFTSEGLMEDPGCDVNGDGIVDRDDVRAIFARNGTAAANPSDPHDIDGDGRITLFDGHTCKLECGHPGCRPPCGPPPRCGLIGIEGLLPIGAALAERRRRRRRGRAKKQAVRNRIGWLAVRHSG